MTERIHNCIGESHADYRAGKVSLGHIEQVDPGLTSSVNLTELQSLTSSSSCRVKELNISSTQRNASTRNL